MTLIRRIALIAAIFASAAAAAFVASGAGAAAVPATVAAPAAAAVPAEDWPTFDFNTQRSGVGPTDTGITAANLHSLRRITVHLPGTVDSSAVELANVTVKGTTHDVAIMTTSYGRTLALNAVNGHLLWEYSPASVSRLQGGSQITTASPSLILTTSTCTSRALTALSTSWRSRPGTSSGAHA